MMKKVLKLFLLFVVIATTVATIKFGSSALLSRFTGESTEKTSGAVEKQEERTAVSASQKPPDMPPPVTADDTTTPFLAVLLVVLAVVLIVSLHRWQERRKKEKERKGKETNKQDASKAQQNSSKNGWQNIALVFGTLAIAGGIAITLLYVIPKTAREAVLSPTTGAIFLVVVAVLLIANAKKKAGNFAKGLAIALIIGTLGLILFNWWPRNSNGVKAATPAAGARELGSRVKSKTVIANQGEWSDFVQIPPWQDFWWETVGCVKVKNSLGKVYEGESCPDKHLPIGKNLSPAEVKLAFLPLERREEIKVSWKPQ